MKTCDNCGSNVMNAYHRVFSDNDGILHSCPHCGTKDGNHRPDGQDSVSVQSGSSPLPTGGEQ